MDTFNIIHIHTHSRSPLFFYFTSILLTVGFRACLYRGFVLDTASCSCMCPCHTDVTPCSWFLDLRFSCGVAPFAQTSCVVRRDGVLLAPYDSPSTLDDANWGSFSRALHKICAPPRFNSIKASSFTRKLRTCTTDN